MPDADTLDHELTQALSGLSAAERENLLDYIAIMRGKPVLDDLSEEDRRELERRALTIDTETLVPVREVGARVKSRLATRKP